MAPVHTYRRKSQALGSGERPGDFAIEVFFDGDCPLCRREIDMLRRLDRHERLRLIDIAAAGFEADVYGRSQTELMRQMHGRLPNGEWVTGMEVIRRMYDAVGFAWLVALTRLPGVKPLADAGYRVFARNRLRWTGRCTDHCQAASAK